MKQIDEEYDNFLLSDDYKPTYIKEQHNNNCQQFFGPITNCTFTMPATNGPKNNKPKASSQIEKAKSKKIANEKPKTLKYYKHGNNSLLLKQRHRVVIVYKKLNEWGWIDDSTSPDDFDSFFEGVPRFCNITWNGTATTLTILLQELLAQDYIEKQTNCKAKSLVKTQFGKTPNSSRKRIDEITKHRIQLIILILDIKNPLPEQNGYKSSANEDISDAALMEIYEGQLRSTKAT